MNDPQKTYMNDPHFHILVDTLENLIHECQLTPLEIRQAAILAAIHYEMKTKRYLFQCETGHATEEQDKMMLKIMQDKQRQK